MDDLSDLPEIDDALPDIELPDLDFSFGDTNEQVLEADFYPSENKGKVIDFDEVDTTKEDEEEESAFYSPTKISSVEEMMEFFTDPDSDSTRYSSKDTMNVPRSIDLEYSVEEEDDSDLGSGIPLDTILEEAIELGASDVHLSPEDQVCFTILGEITRRYEFPELTGIRLSRLQAEIVSNQLQQTFNEDFELDTSYVIRKGKYKNRRFRLSIGRTFGEMFMVFRTINNVIPTPAKLGITGELLNWVNLPNGLVMLNGPTGTGKSTTLASLIQEILNTRAQKIITIEKPVEYVFGTNGKGLITQREVGLDAKSFAGALTSAMRQAPDIIVVGEVRTNEEISELLRAAETGHLAISTMHTNSAPATLNRIKSLFRGDEQDRILATLSDNLRGLANQVLLKTVDGKGRFAVREVLPINPEISEMVLRGDSRSMREYQIEHGITMEHELAKVVLEGKTSREIARSESTYPNFFDDLLKKKR